MGPTEKTYPCQRATSPSISKELRPSSHQPWTGNVLCWSSSAVSEFIFFKNWLGGLGTLCKICTPCAKLSLVQTTREVEKLPSVRRASPA